MAPVPIYTIGHGNRSIADFIALLQRYQISYVADVRSQPYSRYMPHFSKNALEQALHAQHLHYLYLGETLGGRPLDRSCYVDGKVDYALVREKPWYLQGIQRLRTAWEKQLTVALMCSELKPQECHRGKLIGNTLLEQGITVAHIDETGVLREQEEINLLLTSGQATLFDDLSPVELPGKIGHARKKAPHHQGEQ
ncbi:MAG TPA: DUF488 domain-containing protein [Ktedonobacteraceae bacterium]|nr:DUF488 domain-containing protein [Ktedonobacteraceae bacterium]